MYVNDIFVNKIKIPIKHCVGFIDFEKCLHYLMICAIIYILIYMPP